MTISRWQRPANQRGATLTGYALVLATFTSVALGTLATLEDSSGEYLTNTGDVIAEPLEGREYLATSILDNPPEWAVPSSTTTSTSTTTTTTSTTSSSTSTSSTSTPSSTTSSTSTTSTTVAPTPPVPAVTGGNGQIVGPVPDGTVIRHDRDYESDTDIFVFTEGSTVLAAPLSLHDGVTIPAGTKVCSYLFMFSPETTNLTGSLTVDLGAPILGSAQTTSELDDTNGFGNPNATYVSKAWESGDGYAASGSVVTLTPYAVRTNADMIRIFTACP